MANVLNFALGMATSQFIGALTKSKTALAEFVGEAVGAGAMFEGMMRAFEQGAQLEAFHRRTGAAISDIYQLQQGFKAVGLSADDVPNVLFQMQKALGGVNEMGESTPDIFHRMGLSIDDLKKMNAPAQLSAIVSGLSRMDTASAAAAAGGIFGKSTNAATMLQLAHSTDDFSAAIKRASDEAAMWQKIAPTLALIQTGFDRIKEVGEGFFAGIAAGLAPALQAGINWVESMESTLSRVGNTVGNIFRGITEAFKEAKITELLDLTFAASVEFFVNAIANTLGSSAFWVGIFDVAAGAFIKLFGQAFKILASLGTALIAALDTAFQALFEQIGRTKFGKLIGLGGYKAETFAQNYEDEKAKGAPGQQVLDSIISFGTNMLGKGIGDVAKAIQAGIANSGGPEQEKLKNFWAQLLKNSPALIPSAEAKPGTQNLSYEKYTYRPEANALEKMGFVTGGRNSMSEYARRTADGVQKMCGLLETTVNLLGGPSASDQNAI